jgi:hypothetical protein
MERRLWVADFVMCLSEYEKSSLDWEMVAFSFVRESIVGRLISISDKELRGPDVVPNMMLMLCVIAEGQPGAELFKASLWRIY